MKLVSFFAENQKPQTITHSTFLRQAQWRANEGQNVFNLDGKRCSLSYLYLNPKFDLIWQLLTLLKAMNTNSSLLHIKFSQPLNLLITETWPLFNILSTLAINHYTSLIFFAIFNLSLEYTIKLSALWRQPHFYRAMHFSAFARSCDRMSSVCPSVRPSVRL